MPAPPLGVIDIGSNAVRMSIGIPNSKGRVKLKVNERDPIRLGADVFEAGNISAKTCHNLILAIKRYRKIFSEQKVQTYRAVATSALREAKNGKEIVREVFAQAKIKLDIISGEEESMLIYNALANALNYPLELAAYMDIGGGSVEIIVAHKNQIQFTKSFKIGTVRLLKATSSNIYDRDFYVNTIVQNFENLPKTKIKIAAGSGGNVSRLGKLRKIILDKKNEHKIHFDELEQIIEELYSTTFEERIQKFDMRPDRADVILPASIIVLEFMRYFNLDQLEIPDTGLKEGVLLDLWRHLK